MNNTPNLLAQLHDIHPPQSVAWWPLAPGWWIVIALILLLSGAAGWWLRRRKQQQWQREALAQLHAELDQLRQQYQQTHNSSAACAALSALLRRVALQVFRDEEVAGLHGKAWLQFLDNKGLIPARFTASDWGEMLLTAPYTPTEASPDPLLNHSQAWMEAALQSTANHQRRRGA